MLRSPEFSKYNTNLLFMKMQSSNEFVVFISVEKEEKLDKKITYLKFLIIFYKKFTAFPKL